MAYAQRLQTFNARPWWREDLEHALQLAGAKTGMKVLDFGCGIGTAGPVLAHRLLVGVGFEPDPDLRARAHGKYSFGVHGPGSPLDGKGPFHLVLFNHVLNHVDDLDAAMGLCARVLRYDGKMVVINPNPAYYALRFPLASLLGRQGDPTSRHSFTPPRLDRLMHRHRLRRTRLEYVGRAPLRRLAPRFIAIYEPDGSGE